ncbi:antibiotic biosynthesis monooxygenase family protein [Yoonia sp. R78084]|uniref:antibiotic biosynthesis monooxygenase family protein n=1 Tax=Yoonia sp. R78084 TaxID=3093869 RepID=UPI0037DD220F
MHALFFEVRPKPGHLAHYFEHVALLRPVLAKHTGLAFLDRYASLSDADVILSHQLWESEEAIVAWRKDATHRRSQTAGRQVHFTDYRIRVGARVLHWKGGEVTPLGASDSSHVVALYGTAPVTNPAFSGFESVNHKGQFIALATVDGAAAAQALLDQHLGTSGLEEAAIYRIRRDYGQHDRTQAPT